jgi:hypothetical protein
MLQFLELRIFPIEGSLSAVSIPITALNYSHYEYLFIDLEI